MIKRMEPLFKLISTVDTDSDDKCDNTDNADDDPYEGHLWEASDAHSLTDSVADCGAALILNEDEALDLILLDYESSAAFVTWDNKLRRILETISKYLKGLNLSIVTFDCALKLKIALVIFNSNAYVSLTFHFLER